MFEGKILGFDGRGTLFPASPLAERGRPKVRESLQRFREAGNTIIVASAAPSDRDVEYMLQVWELDSAIDAFKAVEISQPLDTHKNRGKLYLPILDQLDLDISGEELKAKMIVTGDLRTDFAADVSGVVFIHDQKGALYSLDRYEQVVNTLDEEGKGNLYEGFCRRAAFSDKSIIDLGNNLIASLRMHNQFEFSPIENFQLPVVTLTSKT